MDLAAGAEELGAEVELDSGGAAGEEVGREEEDVREGGRREEEARRGGVVAGWRGGEGRGEVEVRVDLVADFGGEGEEGGGRRRRRRRRSGS